GDDLSSRQFPTTHRFDNLSGVRPTNIFAAHSCSTPTQHREPCSPRYNVYTTSPCEQASYRALMIECRRNRRNTIRWSTVFRSTAVRNFDAECSSLRHFEQLDRATVRTHQFSCDGEAEACAAISR